MKIEQFVELLGFYNEMALFISDLIVWVSFFVEVR